MRRTLLYIILFLQVMFMGHVQAQNGTVFPVDLNVTLTPPYGPCLDDYVGIGGNRFLCNVLFRDQMKDKTSPVFEYVIEMRVRTMGGSTMIKAWSEDHKAVLGAVEHFDGGRLMKEFLSETNHTGGSTCLKEGPYTMTFRVYDAVSYNRGRGKGIPISQEFSFSVFVDKGAAPELFNPSNKERLSTTTQMVNFQWQLPYVASGMNTYKFVLSKIPQGGNANTDIDNPSYQIRNESVTFPMVQVPVTTLFGYEAQGDGSYAWQVTVCDAEGKQRTNYENQGKSKVFTFTFNDEAWLPDSFVTVAPFVKSINKNLAKLTIDSVEVDNETGAARWTNANLGDADTYHGSIIEVRKKGQDKWTPYIADELKSGDDEQQLPNLKKGVEYEARGQYYQTDNGDTVYAPYGEIVPFTVPSDIDTMNCADDLPALTDCGDAQPKEIHPGDTIIANGKRVFVDSVSYNGDRLSGSGHLDFPIIKFFKFRMQFKNIKVNCAGELVDGEITSVYDMTNAFILDLNNLTGKGNTGDETFNSTEPTVSKVKDLDKAKKTKQPGDYFEVEGEPNVIYSLDKDKNPVKIGTKLANWTSDTFTHANKMYNNEILLKFSNDRKNQGFDSSEEPYRLMAPSKYESVDGYWVPWLASNPGRVCVVKAKLEGGSISNVKDPEHDVKFIMPLSDGGLMELNTQYKGSGEFEITVMGSSKAGDKLEIYAVIKKTDGKNEEYVDAGRLYVPIYEYRTLKMTVVKVNGANASAVDKSSVESYLNEVYGRIGISFEVTVEEFQSEEAKAFLEDGLDVCGAGGFMTATTGEMRQLKRLYMDSKGGSVDEKRLYLFLVNKAQCSEEDSKIDPSAVCGDMPRNSKVGYLFAENAGDQASFNRTIAHELGHGAFAYEHPFDNAAYKTEQGTTHNLMDYVKDDELAYFQWQSTLGLNLTWGFLEGDEDGLATIEGFTWLGNVLNGWIGDDEETKVKNNIALFYRIEKEKLYNKFVKVGGISVGQFTPLDDDTYWYDSKYITDFFIGKDNVKLPMGQFTYLCNLIPPYLTSNADGIKSVNIVLFSWKNSPNISNYQISDFSDMSSSKSRVKAGFYCNCGKAFGLITFFAEDQTMDASLMIELREKSDRLKAREEFEEWVRFLLFKKTNSTKFEWLSSYSNSSTAREQIVRQYDFFTSFDAVTKSGGKEKVSNELVDCGFIVSEFGEIRDFFDALHTYSVSFDTKFGKCVSGYTRYTAGNMTSTLGICIYANPVVLGETKNVGTVNIPSNVDACLCKREQGGSFGLIAFSDRGLVEFVIYVDTNDKNQLEKWADYFAKKDEESMSISIVNADNDKILHSHKVDDNPTCVKSIYEDKSIACEEDYQFLYMKPNETYKVDLLVKESDVNLNDLKISSKHCGSPAKITVTKSVNQSKKTITLSVTSGNFKTWPDKSNVPYILLSQGNKSLYRLYVVPCEYREYNLHVRVLNGKDKNGVSTICEGFDYDKVQKVINEIYNPINVHFKFDPTAEIISDFDFNVAKGEPFEPDLYRKKESKYGIIFIPNSYKLKVDTENDTYSGYAPLNDDYPNMNTLGTQALVKYSKMLGGNDFMLQSHTAPHELGHLVFGLEHPFKVITGYRKDQDWRNLMDYGSPSVDNAIIRAYDVLHINGFSGY